MYINVQKTGIDEYFCKKYNASYLGIFCLKTYEGAWSESICGVYYVDNPDTSKGHTNYFAISFLGVLDVRAFISKGDSAFEDGLTGIVSEEGEVLISKYRHDYRKFKRDGDVFIDGGRDYTRSNTTTIDISVVDGKFITGDGEEIEIVYKEATQ